MWSAYLKLKACQHLPSQDLEETDSIAAWCVDGCVLWFGMTVENALLERVNKGSQKEPKWEARYSLAQLLDPDFRLPRPLPQSKPYTKAGMNDGLAAILAMAGQPGSGVKMWEYVKPS